MSNQHSKCKNCYKTHLPEFHDMNFEQYAAHFNELADKLFNKMWAEAHPEEDA